MSAFDIAAILIVLAAAFGYLNHQTLKLPSSIGLVVVSLLASLGVILIDWLIPALSITKDARAFVGGIDFYDAVMNGMLGFILFAGALHVDFSDLAEERWTVLLTATVGLLLSTFVVGVGFAYLADVPLAVGLVLGALISPTDPVAVLGLLKFVKVPPAIQTRIAGESLFNDGVAVVVFLIVSAIAFGSGHGEAAAAAAASEDGHGGAGLADIGWLFVQEAVGGAALGALAGWATYRLLRGVDEYVLEVLLTLALVMGLYALALNLHTSGPIAVVVAGIFIGNAGFKRGMSQHTRMHVENFWHLIDEILNAALFLLIGIEVLAIPFETDRIWLLALMVPLVLLARTIAITAPLALLAVKKTFTPGTRRILIWGGLRGGISVALALSLPESDYKPLILQATYVVVIFSIVVQGTTMASVIRRAVPQVLREHAEAEKV